MSRSYRLLIRAARIVDGTGIHYAPGAVLLEGDRIVAAGSPPSIGNVLDAVVMDRPRAVVTPAFVNAHAHLDLTHIGPKAYQGSFREWINRVRESRAEGDAQIAASVRAGITLSRRGGVGLIGDIAGVGSIVPWSTLERASLPGVSFVELFGLAAGEQPAMQRIEEIEQLAMDHAGLTRLGVQPHALYSCGVSVFKRAAASSLPVSTHLAETIDEETFTETAMGPIREMLEGFGVWSETIKPLNQHPIEALLNAVGDRSVVAAHVNYLRDHHIELLARSNVSVVYCPRASEYFGHPHEGRPHHSYLRMTESGINVALGTDSVVCLNRADRMTTWDEARLLVNRDGLDPRRALQMATVNGARALGFDEAGVSMRVGPTLGLLALEPLDDSNAPASLRGAFESDVRIEWLYAPHASGYSTCTPTDGETSH